VAARYRYALCEAHCAELNILSANYLRRHMAKGQLAMVVAMIYPERRKRGEGETLPQTGSNFGRTLLTHARLVLKWAPELRDNVVDKAVALEAYARQA
jgi:hypothetical protein